MSRSGYFKDLGNFGQQILNQVASDIRSNAENLVFSFGQEGSQQNPQRNNSENQGSDQPSSKTSRSEASTPSGGSSRTPPGGPPRARRSSSASSSQATTPDEVAGDWLNSVSWFYISSYYLVRFFERVSNFFSNLTWCTLKEFGSLGNLICRELKQNIIDFLPSSRDSNCCFIILCK